MVINMEELTPKKVSESKTEQIQILMPQHINGYKRLFGGVLMEWIDVVAGVVPRRHANSEVIHRLGRTTCNLSHPLMSTAPLY